MPKVTHGMSNTPMYRLWWGMVSRCNHPKTRSYELYGGRGIQVCERWLVFENFYADMGDRPEGMTIERRDTDGPYAKENCYWATNAQQQRNRRNNVRVDWGGATWILRDLCDHLGIYSTHLYRVMRRGCTLVEAIQHLVNVKEKRNAKIFR